MSEAQEVGGFFDWKIGQKPNVAMMFVGFFLLGGIPILFQMHSFRNELKAAFADIDDGLHWINVLIPIFGLYQNDAQLAAKEKECGVQAASSFPWWLSFFLPILWPLVVAAQMERLNVLAASAQQ